MTENQLANQQETSIDWGTLEKVVVQGDLSKLSTEQRLAYYRTVCESVGLNPATQPFEYIKLSGKLTLYPKRDATDQLRRIHRVSVQISDRQRIEDVYVVTARATTPDGRTDESTGVVNIAGLKGDNLANALMKAETKAKRRVTLSIVGLGMLDESELDTIRGAEIVTVEQAHNDAPVSISEQPPRSSDERRPVPQRQVTPDGEIVEGRASQQQIKMISALANEAGVDDGQFKSVWLKGVYNVESRKSLTKDQASELIDFLKALPFAEQIDACETLDDLATVGASIVDTGIHGRPLKRLEQRVGKARERIEAGPSAEDDPELKAAWDAVEAETKGESEPVEA